MVSDGLRALLERGDGVGELAAFAGEGVGTGFSEHPVCGDRVQLSVRVQDGDVIEIRWRASGCPASMAVAALTVQALTGVAIGELDAVLHEAIADHGGLLRHERHAEAMALRALRDAVWAALQSLGHA